MANIIVTLPGRGQITFEEGTPDSVINETIAREFPKDGSDVARIIAEDPTQAKSLSNEDFGLYEEFLDKKKTDFGRTAANAAGYLASTVGAGIKGLFEARNLSPEVAAATAIESGAQGTRDLYGMVAQSEDPSSMFFKFKDWINGTGAIEDRKKQWLEARDFSENTRKMEAGQQTVSGIDPSLINNDVKNALKLIADPTLFIPGVGELLGAGKLGARVTGAAMEAAGRTAQAVTRPLVNIVDASTRMAGEAFGTNVNAIKGLAAGSGVTGVVMGVPGVREAAMAIGTIEGVNKAGQVLETAGQALGRTPTRIGALESLALNPNASAVDRALAKVGRYGGDDLIDLGARSAAGAVEGAVIGTTLGYLSAGEEGAASGLGAGTLLGGAGAGAARLYGKASGAAAIENRHGDFKRFYETLDPATQAKFDTIVQRSGLDGASQVMDVSGLVRGKFNDADVRFSTTEEFAKKYGQDARGVQVNEGDRPIIDINVEKFSSQLTAGHEIFHAFKAIDQLRPMAEKVEQMIVGNYVIDQNGKSVRTATGLLDDAAVVNRFNEYVAKLQPDASSPWSKANTLLEKSKLVGEELGAEYMTRMIAGSDTDVMLRGFDGLTRTILDHALLSNTDGFIRRTAQSIGLGSKPIESLVFSKLENASPALNAALRDMVRARRNMSEKIALADDNGYSISKKDLANPAAAKVATDMGIAEVSPDGIVRMKPDDVLAKEDRESADALANAIKAAPVIDASEPRLREVDGQVIGDGISNAQLAAIQASPSIIDKVKQAISIVKDSIDNGNVIFIRNGKATKEIRSKLTGKTLKRYNDGVRITERDVVPYSLATSKSGELYIRTFDISKARGEAMKLAGRDRLGPYGADFQTFYGDLTRYLNNLSDRENRVPTKELLGDAAKAAYLTEFFGGKDGTSAKYIRNFTLDRMVDMRLTGEKVSMSQTAYDLNKIGFMPAENIGDGKVFNSPDSGFRIISKDAGKHSLYAPTGERVGIYDTQAKAEAVAGKKMPKLNVESDPTVVVPDSDHTTVPGTPAPDSPISDIPITGEPIKWNFMPEVVRDAYPMMSEDVLRKINNDTETLAAIHIDRMRVGQYKGTDLQGGMEYPAIKENLDNNIVWAFNSPGVARTVADRAAKNGGYVKLVLMQEGNVVGNKTFAKIWFDDLKENIAAGKITENNALRELNSIRSKFSRHSDSALRTDHTKSWKTIDEAYNNISDMPQMKRASTYFQKGLTKTKSEGEKIAYQSLLSQKMAASGFPDAREIVSQIEEPAFKGVPKGAAIAILRFDPLAKGEKVKTASEAGVPEHMSYKYVLSGKPVAKMSFYQIVDKTFPSVKNRIMSQQHTDFSTRESIPMTAEAAHGTVNFMPSEIKPNRIEEIAAKVGGGKLKGGAKKFGAFMQEMKDKDITVRDVIKSYGITLSSIQRGDKEVNTVKKRWPDAPFKDGSRVRPEDAFAALLGTADGKKYLDAAEQGTFDLQSAKNMIEKFTTFGLQNKLLVGLKDAAEKFYPKAGEIISAVRSMPTGEYADYVRQNFSGISYGKVGFMSGHLGRGDLPTFDSRQKQLVYGKDVDITKERLLEQRDRLLKLGINVPEKYKEFAQTLLHHEVWDRLNKSDTEHGEIKNAMLNFMPETRVSGQQGSDTTQIATTVKTYGKAAGLFPKNTRILDVGAGLGLGADEMRKNGHSVDTVEPLSARWSSSTPRTFETIDQATEKYPGIVNFSVLNVVEPKLRDQIVDGIGQRLADGGTAYITARTRSDVEGAKNKRPANEAGGYWIKKSGGDVYQKGFSTPELVGYVQTRLGDQFKVKPASGLSGAAIEIKKFMPAMQFSAAENLPNGKVWRGENGYAIIQKEGGKFRVHSPIGLIGIAASYEAAEKMANKRNTK